MFEDVKREIGTWIETYVTALSGRVTSTFPDSLRGASPCATVDVVGGYGPRRLQFDETDLLIRIAIISDDVKEIDSLSDDLDDALKDHTDALTTIAYGGIHDISPILEAFVEKEKYKVFVREIDLKGKHIAKR